MTRSLARLALAGACLLPATSFAQTITIGGNQTGFPSQAMDALGETYAVDAGVWPAPMSADVLIISWDGGGSGMPDYTAHLDSGRDIIVIGGSGGAAYATQFDSFFPNTYTGWHQANPCTSDWNATAAHPITQYLPAVHEFSNQSSSYHMMHFNDVQGPDTLLLGTTCEGVPNNVAAVRTFRNGGTLAYMALDIGSYGAEPALSAFVTPLMQGWMEYVRTPPILLGGNAYTYLEQALIELGVDYTTTGDFWIPPHSAWALMMGHDGGSSGIPDWYDHMQAGQHVFVAGGSGDPLYATDAGVYFNNTYTGWHQSDACSFDWNITAPHPITSLVPANYEFPAQSMSWHMMHFSAAQPANTTILAYACDGNENTALVQRPNNGGTLTWIGNDVGNYGGGNSQSEFTTPLVAGWLDFIGMDVPDSDGDGVPDPLDQCPGHDDNIDFDGDGVADGCDACPLDINDDTDGDGTCDSDDLCLGVDATGDTDGDGVCDDTDPCPLDALDDSDGDGSCDSVDLCTGDDGTGDTDSDGVCDDTDPCPMDNPDDSDGDGSCDSSDLCAGDDNTGDTDSDGVCDDIDPCPLDALDDSDGDGSCDSNDICVGFDDTIDTDGDTVPDGCDVCPLDVNDDSDSDGVCDSSDLCPNFNDTFDVDADGVPDDCDVCPLDALDDSDGDGSCDSDDICAGFDDTVDADGDTVPDGCDVCPDDALDDSDGDLVCDSDDICNGFDDLADADSDTVPDGCDVCPDDALDDSDGDGSCDSDDICAGFDDTVDTDGDTVPDGCDVCPDDANDDSDGDSICDSADVCDGFDDLADADSDGTPDGCDDCPDDAADDSDGDGICDSDDICDGSDDNADVDGDSVPDGCDPCPNDNPDDTDGDGICDSDETGDTDDTDTTDGTDGKDGTGCGCSSNPTGQAVWWLPMMILALALRRKEQGV